MREGVQIILRNEGMLSFFRGNLMNCLKVAPQKALKFVGYENLKFVVCKDPYRRNLTPYTYANDHILHGGFDS